jgi:peptide/nickel transport system substrate-binding protein
MTMNPADGNIGRVLLLLGGGTNMRRLTSMLLAAALALGASFAAPADAKTFRYAFQGDLNSLDPYSLNESFTLGALGNVFEGLTKRDKDFKIIPGLAERWETPEPTRWRFYLRKGVKFHGGEPFTADDVVFSAQRMFSPDSNIKSRAAADMKTVKIDDHTVDFILSTPNPILHSEWDTWYIMSKSWSEANGATQALSPRATNLAAWALKANGTGPFTIASHTPGDKTVYRPNPNWWGKPEHNLTEVIFQTIRTVGVDDLAAAVLARSRVQALSVRSGSLEKIARRSRLRSRRARNHDGLPERPLRQRRGDLPGHRRHAQPRRS